MKKVICICGYKNTGKTTLIQKLIVSLYKKGIEVSVIKHDGHLFDTPHSDTDQYHHSGSDDTAIFDAYKTMYIQYKKTNIETIIYSMKHEFVLIEGLKNSNYPKLYIKDGFVYPSYENTIYHRDDIDSIVNSIMKFTKNLKI